MENAASIRADALLGSAMAGERCCEKAIQFDGWAMSGARKDGDRWTCPTCATEWEHVCDEADGCHWGEPMEGR